MAQLITKEVQSVDKPIFMEVFGSETIDFATDFSVPVILPIVVMHLEELLNQAVETSKLSSSKQLQIVLNALRDIQKVADIPKIEEL